MKKLTQLLFIIGIALTLLSAPGKGSAQTPTVVKIDPNAVVVDPGDTFSMDVKVENVQDLYGFDVIVVFDPTILSANQLTLGGFMAEGLTAVKEINNDTGYVRYAMSLMAPEPARFGSGTLFTIEFTALEIGRSALNFTFVDLVELETNALIPCDWVFGEVQVGPAKENFDLFIPLFINS